MFGETHRIDNHLARGSALAKLPDEKIMAEVTAGNGDAFAVLFDRYHRLILVTALKIVWDVAEAEEVTQSVFLEIYREARQFDPARGSLKVWLLQFAYHRSINRRNYLILRHFYDREDIPEEAHWESSRATTRHFATQEVARMVEQILSMLNEPQRRAIQLVFFEGKTLREVAEETGEPLSSIRNHYYRGLDRLRLHVLKPLELGTETVIPMREVGRAKA